MLALFLSECVAVVVLPPEEVLKQTRSPSSAGDSEEMVQRRSEDASPQRHGDRLHHGDGHPVPASRGRALSSTPEKPEYQKSPADRTPSSRADQSVHDRTGSEISMPSGKPLCLKHFFLTLACVWSAMTRSLSPHWGNFEFVQLILTSSPCVSGKVFSNLQMVFGYLPH